MNVKKLIAGPLIIGILACLIQVVDQALIGAVSPSMGAAGKGLSWVAFQSWALYFLAGCNIQGGIKVFLGYILGIVGSILIIMLGTGALSGVGFFAVPAAVGIVAFFIIFLEHTKWLNLIPAIFIASGAFFSLMNFAGDFLGSNFFMEAFKLEMIYAVIGLVFGVVTVTVRGAVEAKLDK